MSWQRGERRGEMMNETQDISVSGFDAERGKCIFITMLILQCGRIRSRDKSQSTHQKSEFINHTVY